MSPNVWTVRAGMAHSAAPIPSRQRVDACALNLPLVRRNIRNRTCRIGLSERPPATPGRKFKKHKSNGISNYAVAFSAKSGDLRP